jgi:hypothetical protein
MFPSRECVAGHFRPAVGVAAMRFFVLIALSGLICFAAILSLAVSVSHRPPPRPAPEVQAGPWDALVALVSASQPGSFDLPALVHDAENRLSAPDAAGLGKLGAAMEPLGPQRVAIAFQMQTKTDLSTETDLARERDRINAAYAAVARPAGQSAPAIYFTEAPQNPLPLTDTLLARLTISASAEFPLPPTDIDQPLVPPPAAAPEPPDPEPFLAAGPFEDLALGASLELPVLEFAPATATLLPGSAAMLADFGARAAKLGADRFQLFLVPQTAQGISTDADVTLESDRLYAVISALGPDWTGEFKIAPAPAVLPPMTDEMAFAVTLMALPEADPPDWLLTPGAPSDSHALGFVAGVQGRDFALTDPRLLPFEDGMVDLWMSPEWKSLIGHDPTLFEIGDGGQIAISLHLLDNRAGLAVWTGIPGLFLSVPHDFSANRPYHVALLFQGGKMTLMVDGLRLEPAIALLPGAAAPLQIRVGNDAEGLSPFIGRISALRIWHEVPLAADLVRLRAVDLIPAEVDALAAAASSVLWWNGQTAETELRNLPEILTPEAGWYAPLAESDIRLMNVDAFDSGQEAPMFSGMQDAWQDRSLSVAARPVDPGNPGAFGETSDAELNPSFAVRHAFRLVPDQGIDLEALRRPVPAVADFQQALDWPWGEQNRGVLVRTDRFGVLSVTLTNCATSRRVRDRWTCPDAKFPGETLVIFDTDEYLTGMGWQRTDRSLHSLYFVTNKRITPALGTPAQSGDRVIETYDVSLPAGVRPSSLIASYIRGKGRLVDFSLNYDPRHARPGVTLVSETGAAMRFARLGSDRLVSADGTMGLLAGFPGAVARTDPVMSVLEGGRIRIDGVPHDLILSPSHAAANPGTAFNDTFVSLSKAVNLQASYVGYDAVEMDPLHLTRTGTAHPVFAMPDGDSRDYYDANRIFVPRGLHYFPEFTGKHHASITTADTYSEYFDSFSDTVSFGISGKAAPGSFSASATMSGARKSIANAKNSRTRALSRAVFYDLVLDHQHMTLDSRFADEAATLPAGGDYDSFIRTFGTHYPVAVVYGGLGVLELDATETMREQMRQNGVSIKLEASVMLDAESQTSASFGYEHQSEHAETFRDVMGSQVENFYWIGGTHAGASNSGWTVGTDGVAPVHVQLRPIWELLSPLHFSDPAVYGLARQKLREAIDRHIAAAAANHPGGADDDTYVVELRIDGVACTSDRASAMREPGQAPQIKLPGVLGSFSQGVQSVANGRAIALTSSPLKMFPMVGIAVFDGQQGMLRNLVAHQISQTDDYKPLTVQCPSQVNLLERSPYAADNTLFRFQLKGADILSARATYSVLDRLDLESRVLTPPVDSGDPDLFTKGLLAGLSMGISVLVDELTTEDGSLLVRATERVFRPGYREVNRSIGGSLCESGKPCPVSTADLDRLSGRWFSHSDFMPRSCAEDLRQVNQRRLTVPAIGQRSRLYFCEPRRVDYSLRVLQ